jgi:hypothetical protein
VLVAGKHVFIAASSVGLPFLSNDITEART